MYNLSTSSPFLKGLNTELCKLVDSTEYTSDELNCMIRPNNTRSRRPGIDFEELYKFNNQYLDVSIPDIAFQCIEWTDINSPDETETYTGYPYIVCQIGGQVIFFRNLGQPFSGHQEEFVLNLKDYALDPDKDDYMRERCRFTAAYGCIFVASKAIRPLYLRSAQYPEDPDIPVDVVPTGSLSVSLWNSKKGRWAGYGWAAFYLNNIKVGQVSIQDYNNGANGNCSSGPWMLCSTQLADYWNKLPSTATQGIIATPKYPDGVPVRWGINSATKGDNTGGNGSTISDYIQFTAPSDSGTTLRGTQIKIHIEALGQWGHSSETCVHDATCILVGGTNYQYKSNIELAIRDTQVGAMDFLAVDDQPVKMSYAHLYNLLNQGWTPKLIADFYKGQNSPFFPGNNLAQQYLKDVKTNAFKPSSVINMTFGNTPASRGHNKLTFFNQKRVAASNLVQNFAQLCAELGKSFSEVVDDSFTLTDKNNPNETDALAQVPDVKPRKPYVADICTYAGRIFYLSGDVLLYSQVIAEDITRADQCMTEADPTGEEFSDVVETDGGMLSLPDIGEGLKLQVVGDSLLVFGTRGNMVISGTANNIFTATAYSAGAVSAVPTQSPDSFVVTEYGVFYWGITGIYALGIGEGGLQIKDLTTEKLLTFYGKLSNVQHQFCKGIYSSSKKKIYWFYPSNESLPRRLDLCLVYDIQRDAFTPQQIVSTTSGNNETYSATPEVVGGTQLKVPFQSVKEYPIYAHRIVPDDVITTNYYKASFEGIKRGPTQYSKELRPFNDTVDHIGYTYYTFKEDISEKPQYQILVKLHLHQPTEDEKKNIIAYRFGSTPFETGLAPAPDGRYYFRSAFMLEYATDTNRYVGKYVSGTTPNNVGKNINCSLEPGKDYWFNLLYKADDNCQGFVIADAGYSLEQLPSSSSWTKIFDTTGRIFYEGAGSTHTYRYPAINFLGEAYRGAASDFIYPETWVDAGNDFWALREYNKPTGVMKGSSEVSNGILSSQGNIIPYKMFLASEGFDLVTKHHIGTVASSSAAMSSPFSWFSGTGYVYTNLCLSAPEGEIRLYKTRTGSEYVTLENNTNYWFRAKSDGTFYYLKDAEEAFTIDSLPDLSQWVQYGEDPSVFSSSRPWLYLNELPDTTSTVDLYNTGDLVSGWRVLTPASTGPVEIFYNPDNSDKYFAEPEMITQLGTLESLYNNGTRYYVSAYKSWVRQAQGVDKVLVEKAWTGLSGLEQQVYINASADSSFGFGKAVPADDPNVFTNIDASSYTTEEGRIAFVKPTQMTAENLTKPSATYWNVTYTGIETGDVEIVDNEGYKVLADNPLDTEEFTYESSILLCLDPTQAKVTFGDFRNNYMRDWAEGDIKGPGYEYDSYMVSHPVNMQDFVRNKTMPYLISYFKRTETGKDLTNQYIYGSNCIGSVRWDWRTDGVHGKWDSPNQLYRPDKRTILSEGYIITKTNIRGIGRAFQIRLQGVKDYNFVVEALGFNTQKDERI